MKIITTIIFIALMVLFSASVFAQTTLSGINEKVCDRFEESVLRMAAIMEELKARKDVKETRVAFGGVDTPIESADYWINYAAEAIAYQRVQKYSSKNELRSSLEGLKNKILKAKAEVRKALKDE